MVVEARLPVARGAPLVMASSVKEPPVTVAPEPVKTALSVVAAPVPMMAAPGAKEVTEGAATQVVSWVPAVAARPAAFVTVQVRVTVPVVVGMKVRVGVVEPLVRVPLPLMVQR